eukprot:CAMPEP_0113963926 /NCGR_PEP_ID=MMETSP0011_2-20120614/6811_1 /TAXON_ID=101924 /ORGANISM="Rhodosorus marinus" /LENGTH=101 /DNA_ID=CAMNT_0000976083 /DNA_START=165 /DNA_END=470 /DNA_ORIENTATION=- /assembly_acc=CAM_ASM_000156
MAMEKPGDKFIPIAIEAFGRTGEVEFRRDGCKHLLHRREDSSHLRAQLNRRPWQRNASADIALGALDVDQLDNPLVPIFSLLNVARNPGSGVAVKLSLDSD